MGKHNRGTNSVRVVYYEAFLPLKITLMSAVHVLSDVNLLTASVPIAIVEMVLLILFIRFVMFLVRKVK